MLARTKGQIVLGGKADPSKKKMDVTVVRDVEPDDSLLEDEIFGPVLAVVPIDVSFPTRDHFCSNEGLPITYLYFTLIRT